MTPPQFPDTVRSRLNDEHNKLIAPLGFVKGQAPDYSQFETADTLAQEAEIKEMLAPSPRFMHLGGLL